MSQVVEQSSNQMVSVGHSQLIELAINKDIDIDKLDRLLSLQQKWEAQQAFKSFNDAMSLFQSQCPAITRNITKQIRMKNGGSREMSYADLGQISETIKPILNKCGLSYRFECEQSNQMMKVTCIVSHKDGHKETTSITSVYDTSGDKNAVQSIGSTIKYLKRYTIESALGIVASDDDDGDLSNVDAKPPNKEPAQQTKPPETKPLPSSMFDNKKGEWLTQIKEGTASITGLSKYLWDRGYTLSESQFQEINEGVK